MNPVKIVSLDWRRVAKEFSWMPVTQGEGYAVTYLVKHPDEIDTDLQLMGVEVRIPDGEELLPNNTPKRLLLADLVFAKGNQFFVVEAEESMKKKIIGVREAEQRAAALETLLMRYGRTDIEVTPVFAGIQFPRGDDYGYLSGVTVSS